MKTKVLALLVINLGLLAATNPSVPARGFGMGKPVYMYPIPCTGKIAQRPASFGLSCDQEAEVFVLNWNAWGGITATGSGKFKMVALVKGKPHFVKYKVRFWVYAPRQCLSYAYVYTYAKVKITGSLEQNEPDKTGHTFVSHSSCWRSS